MSDNNNLKKLNKLLVAVNKINLQLLKADDEKKLCQQICRYLVQIKNYKFVWLGLKESSMDEIIPVAIAGKEKEFVRNIKNSWNKYRFNGCPTSMALKSGRHFINEDLKNVERFVPWDKKAIEEGFLSVAVLPIKYHDEVIGTLHIYSDIKNYFIKEEIKFLNEVAGDVSIVIKNLRNEKVITEKKKAEEEIKSLAKFPQENPNLVGRIDCHGKLLYCNHAYKRIFKDNDHIPFKLKDAIKKIVAEKIFNQEDVEIEIGGRIFLFNLIPIKKENYINFYGGDITELKKAQENITASEAKYRELFNSAPVGIAVIDNEGTINSVNEAMLSMGGIPKEEILGKNFTEIGLLEPKDIPFHKEIFTKILKGKITEPFNTTWHNRQGKKITGEVSATLLKQDGKVIGFQLSVSDITERKKADEALRESEKNLRMAQRLAKIGSWKWTVATNTAHWSEELCQINGHDPKLPVPNFAEMSSFYTPESWKRLNEAVTKALNNGESYELDLDLIRTDGTIIRTIARGEAGYDTSGKIAGLHGTVQDITERKKIEEALRESEEKYRTLFSTSGEGILIAEIGTLNFKYANPAICQMFGYSEKELKTMGIAAIHPKEALQSVLAVFQDQIRGIYSFATNIPCLRKDGTIFYVDINNTNIVIDGRKCSAGFFHDITERKRAEEALEESKKTVESYLNVAAEIIISMDTLGNITLMNDSGHQLLGYNHNELIGKNWFETCLPNEVISDASSVFEKLMNGDIENIANYENAVKTKSGEIRTILWHNTSLKDLDGNITGTISSGEDITERKNTENKIIYLSYHDHLTGIYNRRVFEEEIKRLNTKRQLPISVIMTDLNSLKLINDTFGHNDGDKILKEAAELLKRVCRSDDILARWGGDEFVILLPKTSNADSEEIMQRIKKECAKLNIQKIPLSLAIGLGTKIEVEQDIDKIIIEAESNMYKNKLIEKESDGSSIIFALEQTLFEKSSETMEHAIRIKDNAIKLGKSIKLHSSQLDELSLLASLHDIGKVAISEKILLKDGKLTEEEWAVIKRHPEIGFNIARSSPQINHIAKFILACHENWDGSGYPLGIKGESIPIISRIIFIADAYDVMTSGRIYKKAMSKDTAIKELKRCAGSQFDSVLVNKFIEILSE